MNGGSDLYVWLEQFRLQDSANGSEATHYSMVGGKYAIPESRHQQWLKRYAMHLQQHAHESVFFVEKRTPIFRMHFDLDYIQPEVPTLVQVIEMVQLLTRVFKTFYLGVTAADADNLFVAIVLKAPSQAKNGNIKTGYHVIWPYLLVNADQALTMRAACITEAIQKGGERTAPYNSYDDLLDECVFMENGLRMVGSDKSKRCEMCVGKKKVNGNVCTSCCGVGRAGEKRVYEPYFVLNAQGDVDATRLGRLVDDDAKHRLVKWCSIRSDSTAPTPGYVKPPLAMQVTYEISVKDRRKRKQAGAVAGGVSDTKAHGCKWLQDGVDVTENKQVREEVEMFIRTSMGCPEWREVIARRMFYSESAQRYLVKAFGIGCQFCQNVHRCHGSSSIYFVINVSGIVQRCYSKKKVDGSVPCSKYASPPVQLSKVLLRVLFRAFAADLLDSEEVVLTAPVQSSVPFQPGTEVMLRQMPTPVHEYVNVLTTLAPRALAAQQLWAQQQAMKLQQAVVKQKGGAVAVKGKGSWGGKRGGAGSGKTRKHNTAPSVAIPTAGLKCEQLVAMDKERAMEQENRVKRLQAEMGNVVKKARRSDK